MSARDITLWLGLLFIAVGGVGTLIFTVKSDNARREAMLNISTMLNEVDAKNADTERKIAQMYAELNQADAEMNVGERSLEGK